MKLPPYCAEVALTPSGRPVLLPLEIEVVLFDDTGVEFGSQEAGTVTGTVTGTSNWSWENNTPDAAERNLRGGALSVTTHRVIWVPTTPSATSAAASDAQPQSVASSPFAVVLSMVTSARQQRKSVKHMFASPRVVLSLQVPGPIPTTPVQKRPGATGAPPPPSSNPLYSHHPSATTPTATTSTAADVTLVFRGQSGPDIFLKKLREVLAGKKWEVKPPPPQAAPVSALAPPAPAPFRASMAGVGGILRMEQERMQQTDRGLKEAFSDLNALMGKASEMVQLADRMRAGLLRAEASRKEGEEGSAAGPEASGSSATNSATNSTVAAAGFGSAQEMQEWLLSVGISSPVTKESAGALFHQQLSRQLADFLDAPLQRSGGMLSLVDVYCLFNRARGTELISPDDLLKACSLWGTLFHPPMQLRRFSSGVLVVQSKACSQEKVLGTITQMLSSGEALSSGVGAVDVAGALGVGTSLALEELLFAEQQGHLCRDDGPDGLRFYKNFFQDVTAF